LEQRRSRAEGKQLQHQHDRTAAAKYSHSTANAEMRGLLKRVVEELSTGNKAEHRQHIPNFSLESQTIPFREEFTGNVQRPLIC